MSTTPPQRPANIISDPHNSPNAEYDAAVAAYETHETLMGPTSEKHQNLFLRHRQIQAHHIKVMEKMASHHSTYQRHEQYVLLLRNALLQSNTALRTAIASNTVTHVQVLTQVTLKYQMKFAKKTLIKMIIKNKKLDKENERACAKEQELYIKSRDMFKKVNRDLRELDRLHAVVLEAGAKIGKDAECGWEDGRCILCKRNEAREARTLEARRVAAEKAEAERAIVEKGGRIRGGMGKAALGKQMLDVILEEDESQDGANA